MHWHSYSITQFDCSKEQIRDNAQFHIQQATTYAKLRDDFVGKRLKSVSNGAVHPDIDGVLV